MSFVNGSEIFLQTRKGHYAVGAFNTNNLEWTRAILKGAQEKERTCIDPSINGCR